MEHSLTVQISHDPKLNQGNSVILPESILHQLIEQNKTLPCFFKITSTFTSSSIIFYTSCLEFTALEESIEIPYVMASTLGIEHNLVVNVHYIENIMPCKYLKIEPQSENFFSIPEYVDVLQAELSQYYSVLYRNQVFHIQYQDTLYFLKVLEIEPDTDELNFADYNLSGNQNCFLLINQDVNTDIYDRFAVERYEKLQDAKKKQKELLEERDREQKERILMKQNDINATFRGVRLGSSSSSASSSSSLLSNEDIRQLRLKNLMKKKKSSTD